MIIDALLTLSDAQALTGTAFSTNTVDLGNVTPKNDIGNGEPMEVTITVDTGADYTTTDETYEFRFVQSVNADLSSEDNLESRIISAASSALAAGTVIHLPIPSGAITKRYIGVKYVLGGTTPSITVTSEIQPVAMANANKNFGYATGFTVA